MFTKETLNKLEQKVQIADVLKDLKIEYIQNKDSYGQCPFCNHFESFAISDIHEKYYCFQCDAKGDSISLIMILKKMSFEEACLYLVKKFDVALKEAKAPERTIERRLDRLEVLCKSLLKFMQEDRNKLDKH